MLTTNNRLLLSKNRFKKFSLLLFTYSTFTNRTNRKPKLVLLKVCDEKQKQCKSRLLNEIKALVFMSETVSL